MIQCLGFADGGLTALGANLFNMGIVGAIGGWLLFRALRAILPKNRWGFLAAAAVASWTAVVAASAFCAVELAWSGTSPLRVALPAMAGVHALIGIGEAVITTAVLSSVLAVRPDLVAAWDRTADVDSCRRRSHEDGESGDSSWLGLLVSLLLAALVSPFASKAPDGLERFAQDKGFAEKGEGRAAWRFPLMPGYTVAGVRSESVGTALAGLAGTLLVFAVAFGAAKLISRRRAAGSEPAGQK